MKEKLTDTTIDILLGGISKKVNNLKEDYEWKKLFVNTGSFLINNADIKSFEDDLFIIFSNENMEAMAKKLKDKRGYDFPQLLHDELYDLLIRYDIPIRDAETHIYHFLQVVIDYLSKNDTDKTLEIFLGTWKNEAEQKFIAINSKLDLILKIITDLKGIEVNSFSISDIDAQIRKEWKLKGMNLGFFELDDDQFATELQSVIDKEIIYVVGKSREETIYRILNQLRKNNFNRVVLVIKSETEWKRMDSSNLSGAILIPFFFAESILAIQNNTNIFVYGEDEPCYNREKLELHKRTKKSLINSLEEIGMDGTEAYNLIDNTHGLYVPLKKRFFNGAVYEYSKPEWTKEYSGAIMAALLCGKWAETDGDKLIFEELSEKKYDECKKELEKYSHGENPFIVKHDGYSGSNFQLASVEDAWEELDSYITSELWNKFINLFYEVLIESEPIFEYPFEKHFEASIYAKQPDWSPVLKKGMIRTLIMRAYYRGHAEYQTQIDQVIEKIFKTINTKERWGYISQYIDDLCEASPNVVLSKLEKEFKTPSGLIELFNANDRDIITDRHYYTHVLWAVEQLLQQKRYVVRAVEWLWEMNSYKIKYSISNSPKSILEVVFCAWLNASALSVDKKIDLARSALSKYNNAWEIIESKLPSSGTAICGALNSPRYREVDDVEELYISEVNKTYVEYLRMCTDIIGTDIDKWKKIIVHLHWYDRKIQNEIIEKIISACKQMGDYEKIQIKDYIRYLIYRHRYFADSDQGTDEMQIKEYEKLLDIIKTEEPVYEYLYLFSEEYEFPLLNPVPYNQKNSDQVYNQNKLLREEEIKSRMQLFKDKNYSLEKLVDLSVQNNKNVLGKVLAQYYCNGVYDEKIFDMLLKKDKEGMCAYDFARFLYFKKTIDLEALLRKVKQSTNNKNLIVNIIKLQEIDDYRNAIIANEDEEIKKEYWSSGGITFSNNAKEELGLWILNECYKFGTLNSYIELLFRLRTVLQPIYIYEHIIKIYEMHSNGGASLTDYYLKEILIIIQGSFLDEDEMCKNIAQLEWYCRNILKWDEMKCTQRMMKMDPTTYAHLVKIIYKTNENDEYNEEKVDLANKLYGGFSKAEFCPAEKNGTVKYEEIKAWLDSFRELLKKQKQDRLFDHIIGRLLAFSPLGEDGYMPCESVRKVIEENFSEALKSSYMIAEKNKRGAYIADAGKSEMMLCEKYRSNAVALQYQYPHAADIYFALSDDYKKQAEWERKLAEDEW